MLNHRIPSGCVEAPNVRRADKPAVAPMVQSVFRERHHENRRTIARTAAKVLERGAFLQDGADPKQPFVALGNAPPQRTTRFACQPCEIDEFR